jgi:TolB-like protein
MNEVWPDEVVEEGNLAQHIFMLRKALGETESCKYIETIPRRGYRFLETVNEPNGQPTRAARIGLDPQVRPSHSLAVLPLVNATGDQTLERVANSLTESLINRLSRESELYVAARNSVLRYQGKEVDARQAGRELGVRNVLLGGLYLVNAAIEIRLELVNADGGWQVYGKNYEVRANAPLEMQEEIASEILAALRIRSSQELEKISGKRHTENSEAYEAYLRGRYYWSKYTTVGLEEAINWFATSINLDPGFSLAYAAIIDCYLRLATNYLPPADPEAKRRLIATSWKIFKRHVRLRRKSCRSFVSLLESRLNRETTKLLAMYCNAGGLSASGRSWII